MVPEGKRAVDLARVREGRDDCRQHRFSGPAQAGGTGRTACRTGPDCRSHRGAVLPARRRGRGAQAGAAECQAHACCCDLRCRNWAIQAGRRLGTDRINELPDGWSWHRLEEVIQSLRNGIFVSRPRLEPTDLPILRISAVRPMALDINDIRYVPAHAKLKNPEDYLVEPGDLLFTRYSGNPEYVGACAMVPTHATPMLHPDKLIRVRVNREIVEPRFLEMAASTGVTRQDIRSRVKTTAGQTGISGSDLKSVPFPVPPIETQRQIIEHVDRMLDWLNEPKTLSVLRRTGLPHFAPQYLPLRSQAAWWPKTPPTNPPRFCSTGFR